MGENLIILQNKNVLESLKIYPECSWNFLHICRISQRFPQSSRSIPNVPECSRKFKKFPKGSRPARKFQNFSRRSVQCLFRFQRSVQCLRSFSNVARVLENLPEGIFDNVFYRIIQKIRECCRVFQNVIESSKSFEVIKHIREWFRIF